MEHNEFLDRYNAGTLTVHVDKKAAGHRLQSLLPRAIRLKQANRRAIGFLGLIVGIALFFLTQWWIAAMVLLASWAFLAYIQKATTSGVLEAALKHPTVYNAALEAGVLKISDKS